MNVIITLDKYEDMKERIDTLERETAVYILFGNKDLKRQIKLLELRIWELKKISRKTGKRRK